VNAIHSEDWRAPIVAAIKGYYESEDGVVDKIVVSHPTFRRKPSAYLYACQDQVSCI
jgi:hypothetical protein